MVLKKEGGQQFWRSKNFNPLVANVSVMKKPDTRFALVKCEKNTCGRVKF